MSSAPSADRGPGRTRARFRQWRRTRPFWGGFFFVLSALALLWSSNLDLGGLQIHMGVEGFLSYLLPGLQLLCGALLWFTPQQRVFYSVVGTGTALYSLIGLNLGGFFLGMLFGMIGGALALAWTPARPPAEPDPDQLTEVGQEASWPTSVDSADHGSDNDVLPWFGASHSDDTYLAPGHAAPAPTAAQVAPEGAERRLQQWPGRTLALIAGPAVLAAAVAAGALSDPRPAAADDICAGVIVASVCVGPDGLAIEPETTPSPTEAPPTTAVPSSTSAAPTSAAPTTGGTQPTGEGNATPSPTPSAPRIVITAPADANILDGPVVATEGIVLTTSKLTLTGITYAGIAVLPTKGAPITAVEVHADSLTAAAPHLVAPDASVVCASLTITAAKVYATSISGLLGGVRITITPTSFVPLGTEVTLTDVTVNLALVQGTLKAPGFTLTTKA